MLYTAYRQRRCRGASGRVPSRTCSGDTVLPDISRARVMQASPQELPPPPPPAAAPPVPAPGLAPAASLGDAGDTRDPDGDSAAAPAVPTTPEAPASAPSATAAAAAAPEDESDDCDSVSDCLAPPASPVLLRLPVMSDPEPDPVVGEAVACPDPRE